MLENHVKTQIQGEGNSQSFNAHDKIQSNIGYHIQISQWRLCLLGNSWFTLYPDTWVAAQKHSIMVDSTKCSVKVVPGFKSPL